MRYALAWCGHGRMPAGNHTETSRKSHGNGREPHGKQPETTSKPHASHTQTMHVPQKILAFSDRIRYPVYRACDWRKKWGTTGEHVCEELPAAWAPCFCGTQAAFLYDRKLRPLIQKRSAGCKAPVALVMHRPEWNVDAHSAQWNVVAEATAPRRENVPGHIHFCMTGNWPLQTAKHGTTVRTIVTVKALNSYEPSNIHS